MLISGLLLFLSCLAVPSAFAAPASSICRISYQPFSTPTGALFEVMQRDRLLRDGFRKQGITLSFAPVLKGKDSAEQFQRGELEVVAMGDMPLIELAVAVPLTVFGQVRQSYSTVVAPRGSIPKDLKGKRIGNVFASTGHYALLKTLQAAGLNEKDSTLIPLEVNQMPEALLKQEIDAFAAWEPIPSQFIAQHPDRFSRVGRQRSSGYLFVSRAYALQHPNNVSLLAASLARAIQWLAKDSANRSRAVDWNLARMQQMTGKRPAMVKNDLIQQITSTLQLVNNSAKLPHAKGQGNKLLVDEFKFLQEHGKLPQTASWEGMAASFDTSIMDRVYQNPAASFLNRFEYDQ